MPIAEQFNERSVDKEEQPFKASSQRPTSVRTVMYTAINSNGECLYFLPIRVFISFKIQNILFLIRLEKGA